VCWELGVVLLLLVLAAAVAGVVSGLGQGRPIGVAAARAALQLTAVSAVLVVVLRSLWLSALFVLLMLTVAAVTSARRVTGAGLRSPGAGDRVATTAVPIGFGALPVLALVLATGTVPLRGVAVIPIGGILIGGAMTATSLAGRRLFDELRQRRGEIEAALALGFLPRDAVLEIVRPAAATALVPALDQTPHRRAGDAPGRLRRCPPGRGERGAGRRRPVARSHRAARRRDRGRLDRHRADRPRTPHRPMTAIRTACELDMRPADRCGNVSEAKRTHSE
jgi:ABC-type iron transport system FetAB permease component